MSILNTASERKLETANHFYDLTADATPIALRNFLYWAKRTAGADLFMRQESAEKGFQKLSESSLSIRTVLSSISPNLKAPLFVVGAPRSGTTFLGDCINVLPEYSYHFEPVATVAASRYLYHNKWSFQHACFFYRLVYKWLMRIHLEGNLRFTEKSPDNCFLIPFLHQCFPDAKFIHIIRDGRDSALSNTKKPWLSSFSNGSGLREPSGYLFGSRPRYWVEPDRALEFQNTSDIHRCIWCWRRHVEAALNHSSFLPSNQFFEVRYESLVTYPELNADEILDFLEIDEPKSKAIFRSIASKANINSIGTWKRELSSQQKKIVEQEAGALLESLGYQ